jgi:hypothetical protein
VDMMFLHHLEHMVHIVFHFFVAVEKIAFVTIVAIVAVDCSHNPKVVSSSLAPATTLNGLNTAFKPFFFLSESS